MEKKKKLRKTLGLWDVYAIATGAMFSSGFFLLPAIVVTSTGSAATLAYLIAGLLMVPAAFAMLELATALPRAGGAYYFIDRSLGPAVGTIAGLGTWLSLVLKSAFALVGIGAYLAVMPGTGGFIEPGTTSTLWFMKLLAVALTGVFVLVNIVGAKESTRLQKLLVAGLLCVLALFIGEGLWQVSAMGSEEMADRHLPFLHTDNGIHGLFVAVGVVFVSYAGLTKVASVSEEVRKPERDLPLGVFMALITTTLAYVLGVFVMISLLGQEDLSSGYAPVADAAAELFDWLPGGAGVTLVGIAALFAFISTGNAGILAASRYPLAMARDHLVPVALGRLGRFHTPTVGIGVTGVTMVVFIVALPLADVAKLGSTFNLLVFGLLNLAVIVMRESRLESYDPSFRVPLYPWLPVLGMLISGLLIVEMGWMSISFSLAVIVLGLLWYLRYARPRVERSGASHYIFARLGRYRHPGLRAEFWEIIKEKGLRDDDPYDEILHRAAVIEVDREDGLRGAINKAAANLAARTALAADELADRFAASLAGDAVVVGEVLLLHLRVAGTEHSELVLVRCPQGLDLAYAADRGLDDSSIGDELYGLFFLISPEQHGGHHLRVLAELAARPEDPGFISSWRSVKDHTRLREILLRDARFLELFVGEDELTESLAGTRAAEIDLPPGAFLAGVRRSGELLEPRGETVIEPGDHITILGEEAAIEHLYQRYVAPETVE
ncbi:amino acid transporter [Kineobactrum sediminis]|uniref:Amino acid transporter n=1 Tax=Kineobactrum sediminis TaxID=1905677 RepID=A0A2N5Y471_9GAMM|nr:amino acid permease [Kineobactrum sediminis]PLW83195.1 amino acid transporter [Kineobactrum sediminis]